jgi:hypothetical protein
MFFALECAPEFKHIVKFDWRSLFMAVIQEAAVTPLCTCEIRRAVLESKPTAKVTVCVSDHNLIGKLQRIGVGSSVIVVRNARISCIFGELPTLALNVRGHESLLPQHQIHHPGAADVRSRPAAMAHDVRVATARFRKDVGQFRQPLEGTVIVDGMGDD